MSVTTTLSYEENDYVLDPTKFAASLILFVGESPKPDEVKHFVHHLYGENIKIVENKDNHVKNGPSQQIPPEIQNIQFERRKEPEKLVFPDLPKLERSDAELEELLTENKDKLTEQYANQLILRAERVLTTAFEKKINSRVQILIQELDEYRQLRRTFAPKQRQRVKQQALLEKLINKTVEENDLKLE
jgi:hypothetical protein